jgi:predicted Rossmann fold nucleotide-binding protein DprA/Smf involved in DNA uptake
MTTPAAHPEPRRGIKRSPHRTVLRPLSARHLAVLDQLTTEPLHPRAIARKLDITPNQALSALYALARRELATKLGLHKGWVKTR